MPSGSHDTVVLPPLPVVHSDFIRYVHDNQEKPILELLQPFKDYDNVMRRIFAQSPDHEAISRSSVIPLFGKPGVAEKVLIRARNLDAESAAEKERYIMPLQDVDRKPSGSPAIVPSLQEFRKNFSIFSESSLSEMDWSNVVCAGSAVTTCLKPIPAEYADSKRSRRVYYHEKTAPASDVDLFLYGLNEEQAIEKIKQIEKSVRDSILTETTTIRSKNAITIASKHPNRHVQIVLRIYKSISEILTGFDVDCSCAAYDGQDVYVSPRALVAYMTQINTIDLTRRSPSYENRLSKYSKRGFEIHWPNLEREKVDPTIFERHFGKTIGLARLLVLEKLPSKDQRDAYQDQRRQERGRPMCNRIFNYGIRGNVKEENEDDIPDWVEAGQESDYHTFTIPYGPRIHAKQIERLLYAKDLLLNAEWNKPRDRDTNLHRHPAFFGSVDDVIGDCCGYCPKPVTPEDEAIFEEESRQYVSGPISFMKDDPGRQAIGSFNPITDQDWTEMAYIGNNEQLCQAIVDHDLEHVESWLKLDDSDPNRRDHTGRTPLQLAVSSSSDEIVQTLIHAGARLVARMADGKTALHLAAMLGKTEMVHSILRKSEQNEEAEGMKVKAKLEHSISESETDEQKTNETEQNDDEDEEEDSENYDEDDSDDVDATSIGSFVKIRQKPSNEEQSNVPEDNDRDEPDIYDVNVTAWDIPVSPLHLAIINGHVETARLLVAEHCADPMLPVKLVHSHNKAPRAAILPIVLAMSLPWPRAEKMVEMLIEVGASVAQADMNQVTAFHHAAIANENILRTVYRVDVAGSKRAAEHLAARGPTYDLCVRGPLQSAIEAGKAECAEILLSEGVQPSISVDKFIEATKQDSSWPGSAEAKLNTTVQQPVIIAVEKELPALASKLLDAGADVNTITIATFLKLKYNMSTQSDIGTLLDRVNNKIEKLKQWKGDSMEPTKPSTIKSDDVFLGDLPRGTYLYWRTLIDVKRGRKRNTEAFKRYDDAMDERKSRKGFPEKQGAISKLIQDYQALSRKIEEMGGKTLTILHPDITVEAVKDDAGLRFPSLHDGTFVPTVCYYPLKGLTQTRMKGYDRLFQACWGNDENTVKELTLAVWDGDNAPLQIAATDGVGFSPFSIAVLRGHRQLADTVLEIAQAQYANKDGSSPQKTRYVLGHEELDDYDSEPEVSNFDEVRIHSHLVDDVFTVDDIGAVQAKVMSEISPITMLQCSCPIQEYHELDLEDVQQPIAKPTASDNLVFTLLANNPASGGSDGNEKGDFSHKPRNLFQLAIYNNDLQLLSWLLDLAERYTEIGAKMNDESSSLFVFPKADFLMAVELGRTSLLSHIIQRTGAGIPLDALVEKSGIETEEKPKHYQGLSVYGKKRTDWAVQAGRPIFKPIDRSHPPLLEGCRLGSHDSVEYFLSDLATRHYREFAEKHSSDKRLQTLAESQGGLNSALGGWLTTRSDLAIHCVVLGNTTPESLKLLEYLLDKMPDQLETKSIEGYTPLLLAFALHLKEVIETLIKGKADQTARDARGRNILHAAIERHEGKEMQHADELRPILSLIDSRLLPSLAVERCVGSLTPLAAWLVDPALTNWTHMYMHQGPQMLTSAVQFAMIAYFKTIVSFTKGVELSLVNSAGETPLHTIVRRGLDLLIPAILEVNTALLRREDATGRTPFEVAEDQHLSEAFANPPEVPGLQERQSLFSRPSFGILNRAPETFVDDGKDDRSVKRRVWDAVRQGTAIGGASKKRKLCALAEANEVAKRLATSKDKHEGSPEPKSDQRSDEVMDWFKAAKGVDCDAGMTSLEWELRHPLGQ